MPVKHRVTTSDAAGICPPGPFAVPPAEAARRFEVMKRIATDEDVRQFIVQHVSSVWALEFLLLMKRDVARVWTAPVLEREMRASETLVSESPRRLVRAGLVQSDGCAWRYGPMSPDLDDLCARLEMAYRDSPVAIINLIAGPRDVNGGSDSAPSEPQR